MNATTNAEAVFDAWVAAQLQASTDYLAVLRERGYAKARRAPALAMPGGVVRAPAMLYGTAPHANLYGQYFTPATFTGYADRLPVVYQHGEDALLGKRHLTTASVITGPPGSGKSMYDGVGLWVEYRLDLAQPIEAFLFKMCQHGLLGHSTSTARTMLDAETTGGAVEVTSWPIVEVSMHLAPADPRQLGFYR